MNMINNVDKLFVLLMSGGLAIAASAQTVNSDPAAESEFCLAELSTVDANGQRTIKCLDGITDEAEIIRLVKEAQTPQCLTPFCGCWLG